METRPAEESFEGFYRRTFDRIAGAARVWVGSDAEDVAQEAFLVARDRWSDVAELEQPGAWVRRVALRLAARRLRRDRERIRLEAAIVPRTAPMGSDLDLAAALLTLPDRHALAVRLHHLEDRPIAELSDVLGCSEGAAKVLLHRARRVLAERVTGLAGRWVTVRTWTPDAIVRHLTTSGSGSHVGPILDDDLGGRGGRFELTIMDGSYVLLRDDGARFDHGASRVVAGALEMAPVLNTGRARYRPIVEGRSLSFRFIDSTTPPTRGVPDAVWANLFLEASSFVRADVRGQRM